MTVHKALKAIVIGCGSIGALKPDKYDKRNGKNILTHAHAYKASSDIELSCVVDSDINKAKQAGKKWAVPIEDNIEHAIDKWKPDIVSVCVPTEHHYEVLNKIINPNLRHIPKLVIAEKPFCCTLEDAQKITNKYSNQNVPILINYTRRFSLAYQGLHKKIQRGLLGKIYHARLLYGRGLLRDGCHGIDLFNWYLGNIKGIITTDVMHDYLPQDPTVSMLLNYENCANVQLIGVDSRQYGIFEMELVAEKAIIRLMENGMYFHSYYAREEKTYGKYKTMPGTPSDALKTDLTNALGRMVSNASRHLLYNEALQCVPKDALKIHATINAVIKVNELTEKEKKKRCVN